MLVLLLVLENSGYLRSLLASFDLLAALADGAPRSFAIRSSKKFSKTPFVGHSIHEWVTLLSKPVKRAVIRTVVEEPFEVAKNDKTVRASSQVPKMFEGRRAYNLRRVSDMSPELIFSGSVVINPFALSIVLITANDEISETKTPHTLSNPA